MSDEISISDEKVDFASRTWTATCRGRKFYCSATNVGATSSELSCTEAVESGETGDTAPAVASEQWSGSGEPAATGGAPRGKAPQGAAGFTFGSAPTDASAVCTGAGHEWAQKADVFSCSAPPTSVGFEASVELSFCADKLCRIDVLSRPPQDESDVWLKQLSDIQAKIVKKYGAPTTTKRTVPEDCRQLVLQCVKEGRAAISHQWQWPDGNAITLGMGKVQGTPAIRLRYALPEEPAPGL